MDRTDRDNLFPSTAPVQDEIIPDFELNQRKKLFGLEHKINRQLLVYPEVQKDFDIFVSSAISSIQTIEMFEYFIKRYDQLFQKIVRTVSIF